MIPLWFLVALAAEIFWVAGNLFDKYLIERYFRTEDENAEAVGTLILFSALFSSVAAVVIFAVEPNSPFASTEVIGLGIINGVLTALWLLPYLYAIERTELSRVIPILQTIPVFGLILAFVFLGEALSITEVAAIIIILMGAVILSYHRDESEQRFDYISLVLMLTAAFILASSDTLFKGIALESSYWNTAFWTSIGFLLFGIVLYCSVPRYRKSFNAFVKTKNWKIFGLNGVNEIMDNLANFTFAFATLLGPLALVQSVNAYQPLLILLAGIVFTKIFPKFYDEDIKRGAMVQKIVGIACIVIGTLVIYYVT